MATAYLLTGSNVGDRLQHISTADVYIAQQAGTIITSSAVYETAPWGNTNQGAFLNKAVAVETDLTPGQLLHTLLHIEQLMGRTRTAQPWQPRTIDIDILLYDDMLIDTPDLHIPHPLLSQRRFALVPLYAIAPQAIYVRTNDTIETLLANCPDTSLVTEYPQPV